MMIPIQQTNSQKNSQKNNQQAIITHLAELRTRLFRCIKILALASVAGLFVCKPLYNWLKAPMLQALPAGSFFITTEPFESYVIYMKVAFLAGLFVSSPYLFYQLWSFLSPGLNKTEKKLVLPSAIISALLFVGGGLFGYFFVFPAGFYYVNAVLEGTDIHLLPRMSDYFSVAMTLLFAFGFSFELPLAIFILGKLGVIDHSFISKYRRYVIVILFIAAGILTPGPDVLSQCLLAFPLWILFELGGLSLLLIKKQK